MQDRKPAVTLDTEHQLTATLENLTLDEALDIAYGERDDAASVVEDLERKLSERAERGAPNNTFHRAIEANLETAERHLMRAEHVLFALERLRDAETWSRRQADVTRVIVERIAQVGRLPSLLLDVLGAEVVQVGHEVRVAGRDAHAADADRLLLAQAALYIARERWDVVSRLMVGIDSEVAA